MQHDTQSDTHGTTRHDVFPGFSLLQLSHDELLPLPFEHIITHLKSKQDALLAVSADFLIKLADAYSRNIDKQTLEALELRYNSPKKSIFRLETV